MGLFGTRRSGATPLDAMKTALKLADGQMAVDAYLEATDPDTPPHRAKELRQQLLTYCRLDTWAMVRLWAFLVGRPGVVEGGSA